MENLALILFFILGTIVGSFLNVVIYRFKTGKKITRGRSICMTCGRKLRWYELIPVFSFLIQRGRCRRCHSRISPQYIFVEIGTGLLFGLVLYNFLPYFYFVIWPSILLVLLHLIVFSLLVVILVYDLRHKIIPNHFVYPFIIISLLLLFVNPLPIGSLFIWPGWTSLLSGPILALPFVLLWSFSRGRLMGLGDGKLILGIGWFLGLGAGLFSLILGFWIGALTSLILIIFSPRILGFRKRKIDMKTEVPLAPFLIISLIVTFFFSFDVSTLARLFG
jgi:prepilin signal peptidase PulO-like enzyme (type II secretory pathway)